MRHFEAKSRYLKDYLLTKRQVDRALKLCEEFLLGNGVPEEELEKGSKK